MTCGPGSPTTRRRSGPSSFPMAPSHPSYSFSSRPFRSWPPLCRARRRDSSLASYSGRGRGFLSPWADLSSAPFLPFPSRDPFRGLVKRYLERSSAYARFEHLVEHQGIFLFFFLFLFPGFPKDFLCYILGLSRMPWQIFLFITGIGRIPGTLMLTLQGASVYDGDVGHMALVFGVTALMVLPAWLARERLYAWVEHRASPQGGDWR